MNNSTLAKFNVYIFLFTREKPVIYARPIQVNTRIFTRIIVDAKVLHLGVDQYTQTIILKSPPSIWMNNNNPTFVDVYYGTKCASTWILVDLSLNVNYPLLVLVLHQINTAHLF